MYELNPDRHLPIGPFIDALAVRLEPMRHIVLTEGGWARSIDRPIGVAELLGRNLFRNYYRGREVGYFTWTTADKLACAIGHHPSAIWGELWWQLRPYVTKEERNERSARRQRERRIAAREKARSERQESVAA